MFLRVSHFVLMFLRLNTHKKQERWITNPIALRIILSSSLFLIAREDFVDVFFVHFWRKKAYDKDYYKAS